jgi:hypothetical protein
MTDIKKLIVHSHRTSGIVRENNKGDYIDTIEVERYFLVEGIEPVKPDGS